jgi:hypothetical protein
MDIAAMHALASKQMPQTEREASRHSDVTVSTSCLQQNQ